MRQITALQSSLPSLLWSSSSWLINSRVEDNRHPIRLSRLSCYCCHPINCCRLQLLFVIVLCVFVCVWFYLCLFKRASSWIRVNTQLYVSPSLTAWVRVCIWEWRYEESFFWIESDCLSVNIAKVKMWLLVSVHIVVNVSPHLRSAQLLQWYQSVLHCGTNARKSNPINAINV